MTVFELPTLESERIRLEPLCSSHSGGMFDLWREPAVCKHSGSATDSAGRAIQLPAASREDSDRLLDYWVGRAQDGTGFRWAAVLAETKEFIGAVGFNALGSHSEYAYHLVPRFWGKGLATDSSLLALSWVFSNGSESVELFIEPENVKSIRLAERLGFDLRTPPAEDLASYVLSHRSWRRSC